MQLNTHTVIRHASDSPAGHRKTVHTHLGRHFYAVPLKTTPPGTLTAHEQFLLVLLCSHPDTVRGCPLRKTQTSTSLQKASHRNARLKAYARLIKYIGF